MKLHADKDSEVPAAVAVRTEYTSLFVFVVVVIDRPARRARGENRAGTTEGHEQSK